MKWAREKAESVWSWHASLHSKAWKKRKGWWASRAAQVSACGQWLALYTTLGHGEVLANPDWKGGKQVDVLIVRWLGKTQRWLRKTLSSAEEQRRGRHLWIIRPSGFTSGSHLRYRAPRTMLENGLNSYRFSNEFWSVGTQSWEGWGEDRDRKQPNTERTWKFRMPQILSAF